MSNVMPRRRKDGSFVYRARVRRLGICISRTFPTEAEALAYADRVERDVAGRAPAEIETLASLIDRYSASAPATGHERLRYWRQKIGHLRLAEVTPAVVRAHRDALTENPTRGNGHRKEKLRTPSTVRKYLHSLSAAFRFAISELNWGLDNPVSKVAKPRSSGHRIRYLSDEQRNALLRAARESPSKTLHAAVLVSLTTGIRRGELAALEWSDINLKTGHALIRRSKNGSARGVPLTAQAIEALSRLPREDQRVFPVDLSRAFHTAVVRAGLINFRWHDMRHDAGTRLTAAGVSTRIVMAALGHKTQSMALVYQHVADATTRAAVLAVMEEKSNGG